MTERNVILSAHPVILSAHPVILSIAKDLGFFVLIVLRMTYKDLSS